MCYFGSLEYDLDVIGDKETEKNVSVCIEELLQLCYGLFKTGFVYAVSVMLDKVMNKI